MMMRPFLSLAGLLLAATCGWAQTRTTEQLVEENKEALNLFFYRNTLRMLNQSGDPEFDELIRHIEKMRFLLIDRGAVISLSDFKKTGKRYAAEGYEEMMSSRMQGRFFDVWVREREGQVKGTVMLVADSTQLYVLDILGRVALDKASKLFQTIDQSADVGRLINRGAKNKRKEEGEK